MKDITKDAAAMQALQTLKNLGATTEEVQTALAALPAPVLHLYIEKQGGDVYAARDLAHAKELWKSDTGQDPDDGNDWQSIPDDKPVPVDDDGDKVTKTAGEWASEMAAPGACFGENY